MKRIVDRIVAGDTAPASGQLHVSPTTPDTKGLVLTGTRKGTQTANLFEWYDTSDARQGYITPAGTFVTSASVGQVTSADDSARVGGNLASAFLTVGGSAGDSAKLQGNLASVFSKRDGTVSFTGPISGTGAYFSATLSANSSSGGFQFGTYVASAGISGVAAGMIPLIDATGTVRYLLCT
jgi:hypothetical protein